MFGVPPALNAPNASIVLTRTSLLSDSSNWCRIGTAVSAPISPNVSAAAKRISGL